MSEEVEEIIAFKILLLGNSEVGKTSFILRFCEDKFIADSITTIGLDAKTKFIKMNNKKIQLIIWDTAGQERFKALCKNTFKGADGIILMYGVNNKESFKGIREWINNIKEHSDINKIGIIIIGNKCDLEKSKWEVDDEMVESFKQKEDIEIIEASAKNNVNVSESFTKLVNRMMQLNLGKKCEGFGEKDDEKEGRITIQKKKKKKGCC